MLNHPLNGLRRRDWLAGAAGVTLAAAASRTRAAENETPYIDAHVHVWTPDTARYPLAPGFKKSDMSPASFTPEELFRHAKPNGVGRIVLIQMSYYHTDNTYMLEMMKQYPGVFAGVAIIEETKQAPFTMGKLRPLGVTGFRIQPRDRKPDQWLQGDGMQAMWAAGAKNGQAMCHLINPEFLPSVDAMCRKHPDTPVVIDHFARIGIDGEIREADLKQLCQLAEHKHTYVKISAYYALGKKLAPYTDLLPMIRRLLDAFGPERLMWASDCPFQVVDGHAYKPSIDLIKQMTLSDGDRDWLLRRTAEKVFFS
ncbi:MAG: amidohydrolase [Planctomycetales bacterium]|nr:amidohydrolase [Planctomycetales bacterium]